MKICKSCKHWVPSEDFSRPPTKKNRTKSGFGECHNYSVHIRLVVTGFPATKGDFGCNFHKGFK